MTTDTNHTGTAAFMRKLRAAIQADNDKGILTVNLLQKDPQVAQELITQIAAHPEGTVYSPELTALYNEIPGEWFAGVENIPSPADSEAFLPAACFGEFKANATDCKTCLKENTDEALRCQDDKAAKKAVKAKKPKNEAKPKADPRPRSAFGHMAGSMSAQIDAAIQQGIHEDDLVKALITANPKTDERKALVRLRSHIMHLPQRRGVSTTITMTDNGITYKTDAISAPADYQQNPTNPDCVNVIIDTRTPKAKPEKVVKEKAEKEPKPKAEPKPEKVVKEKAEKEPKPKAEPKAKVPTPKKSGTK